MTKLWGLILFVLILMGTGVYALEAENPNPSGELQVNVVASATPDFIKEWVGTPFKHTPYIKGIREVIPDQMFHVAVLATGVGIDQNGNTNLEGDFKLEKPDGTLMLDEKNVFSHKRKLKNVKPGFFMLDPPIDLILEKKDPRGGYIFRAVVRDNVLNKTVSGEYRFALRDKIES